MKFRPLFLAVFTFFLFYQSSLKAQQDSIWAPTIGTTWIYDMITMSSVKMYKMEYVKDTILQTRPVKQIKVSTLSSLMPPQTDTTESFISYEYFYQNGDTLFWWVDDKFKLLYIFSEQISEQWQIDKHSFQQSYYCDTSIISDTLQIQYVSDTLYDGQLFTKIKLESINRRWGIGDLIKGIGAISMPFPDMLFDSCMIIDGAVGDISNLLCYQDSIRGTVSMNSFTDCTALLAVDTEKQLVVQQPIRVFPNPAQDILNMELDFNQNWRYSILNIFGQIVESEQPLNAQQIEIYHLPKGSYIIQLENEAGNSRFGQFMKM